MSAALRIGFLSEHNPYDRNAFSGTPYYMLRALQAHPGAQVRVLGGHRRPRYDPASRILRKAGVLRRGALQRRDIDDAGLDAILAPVASGLVARIGAALQPPIVMLTDATPAFVREFYGAVDPEADRTEARALSLAAGVVYSSHFMADRALAEFPDLARDRVHVIPFGLNLDRLPGSRPQKPPLSPLRLLFIGKNWQRKGGDRALAALDALRAQGIAARLTVIGDTAPEAEAHPDVEMLGFLDKNTASGAARLTAELAQAHVFVLPTRADCTPMVVAEANAYGCPVLITETGGIPSLMAPGQNGRMLPETADGAAWAAAIREITADPEAYERLSAASFAHCHARLTWDVWARDMIDMLNGSLGTDRNR